MTRGIVLKRLIKKERELKELENLINQKKDSILNMNKKLDSFSDGRINFSQKSKMNFLSKILKIDITKEMAIVLNGFDLNNGHNIICEKGEKFECIIKNDELISISEYVEN